jgi:hypothetical protein
MTDMGGGVWEYTWDTSACGDPAENPITIDVSGTDPDCSDTRNAPQITNITVDNTCSDPDVAVITIDPPTSGSTVSGSTLIRATVTNEYERYNCRHNEL